MTLADRVRQLEILATTPDLPDRHTRLVTILAPLGSTDAEREAYALEAHGYYIRTSPHANGHDVLLHAEAEVAAYRLEVAA